MSLWQEAAENFYPQRADFTASRVMGQTYMDNLTTSYPLIAQRDLGNAIGGLMRPKNKIWGNIAVEGMEDLDVAGRKWLEMASVRQYGVLYNRQTQFVRASKEADHDFTLFGQAVLQKITNAAGNGIIFRTHHLRDVVWCENGEGVVDTVHRKWKPTILELNKIFQGKISPKLTQVLEKEPYRKVECRHIIIPNDGYLYKSGKKWKQPFLSVTIDVENQFVMEEIGSWDLQYIIPRWQTVSGSQYAYSPALIAALPDARLIQAMTLTLLEAGEKAANPPMLATTEAIRGDISLMAGGITMVDSQYDERLGEVLRPITQNYSGLPMAIDLQRDTRQMIASAFFLDKISLPMMSGERTAFEISQRVSEYIRNALPLFEPLEHDYNGAIYEMTFNDLLRRGVFGSIDQMPDSLSGREIKFVFDSPLTQALGEEKGQKFAQNRDLLLAAAQLDPSATNMIDVKEALRDVMIGIRTPAAWLRDEEELAEMDEAAAQEQMMAKTIGMAQQGGQAAESLSRAAANVGAV